MNSRERRKAKRSGKGADRMPVVLVPGDCHWTPEAVAHYGKDMLDAIRRRPFAGGRLQASGPRFAEGGMVQRGEHPIAAHGAHDDGPMKYPVTFPDGQARIFDTPEEATIATRAWVEAENLRAKGRRTILGLADGEEWGVGALLAAGAVLLVLAAIVVLVWTASGSGGVR